ncbi:MAG: Hpt domain-containing protein [Geobacteraceae bacterium]|nr:Hpt domain-containing protein [Geobacteraceae bacterium]
MTDQDLPQTSDTHHAMIDWSVLEAFLAFRRQGGPDPRIRLINVFLTSSPALLGAIRAALQSSDAASLSKAAHSMKSGSLNMGAVGLGGLCAALEKIGRNGTTDKAGELFAKVEREYAAVEAAFSKIVSENQE